MSWDFHEGIFAYISVELPREKSVKFMFYFPSPWADFENNSSPHSHGWSPGPSVIQAWAWCHMGGFAPGQGVGVGAGAEQSQALSTTITTRYRRHAVLPYSQHPSLIWLLHLSISFTLEATRLSVATLEAGLWSWLVPLSHHYWFFNCFFIHTKLFVNTTAYFQLF